MRRAIVLAIIGLMVAGLSASAQLGLGLSPGQLEVRQPDTTQLNALLLVDGVSPIFLVDGSSSICLASGC